MTDLVSEDIESAINLIANTVIKSANIKKELKNTILETVSNLRNLFVKLNSSLVDKTEANTKLENQVIEAKKELSTLKTEKRRRQEEISRGDRLDAGERNSFPLTPNSGGLKNYSSALTGKKQKMFRLTVKSKFNESTEAIKQILKSKINPREMKVGVNTFKSLRDGRIIIEARSKEEIEVLESNINNKCGETVEARVHKLFRPRIIILNVPEDITPENSTEAILAQNPELGLKEDDLAVKFCFTTKRNARNLVVEVNSETRLKLLQNKIKLGWLICKCDDYVVATRCFKCSRYNHKQNKCKGEITCPNCAGDHLRKDCTASESEYKCINCIIYNKYHKTKEVCIKHSSLDKNCSSLHAILEKYKQNIDY